MSDAPDKPGMSGAPRSDLRWTPLLLDQLDLAGLRTAVIGGTGGLGRTLAQALALRGAEVIVVGQTFRDEGTPRLSFIRADLSLMSEAQRVGRELPAETLDLVVFTTGIFAAPQRQETTEGIERDMAVSYLSRYVVLRELAPRLGTQRTAPKQRPRVFVMGFPGNNQGGDPDDLNGDKAYSATAVHMNTVAANEALVLDAHTRWANVDFFGLNPGLIKTNIRANFLGEGSWKHKLAEWLLGVFMMSADGYARRSVPLLVARELEGRGPAMFNQKGMAILASKKMTPDRVRSFADASAALAARAIP
jgi:NAD(P)-dependent dehydrogenase (short-subunit alcohol dehydrogenase family)